MRTVLPERTPMASPARPITETTDLGIGMLIAEAVDGAYEPVAPVSTMREAREMADHDLRRRMADLESGGEPMCPTLYRVWARNDRGEFSSVAEIEAD
jgi:hypothetical protein